MCLHKLPSVRNDGKANAEKAIYRSFLIGYHSTTRINLAGGFVFPSLFTNLLPFYT